MHQSPSWEVNNHSANQEISRPYRTGSLSCSQGPATGPGLKSDETSPQLPTVSQRSILILSFHLRLGLPSGLFHSGFASKILYAFLISPIRATCSAYPIPLDLIILIIFGELCKLWSSSCSILQPPALSSLLGPNILLSTLFSSTPNLCPSLSAPEQVSHPYKTKANIMIYAFRQEMGRQKILNWMVTSIPQISVGP